MKKYLTNKKKFLIISNSGEYLYSHRNELIKSLKNDFEIFISAPNSKKKFKKYRLTKKYLTRGYRNFFYEINSTYQIYKIIKELKPDLINAISLKVCIIVLILNFFFRIKCIYSITGLGYVFSPNSNNILKILTKFFIKLLDINKNFFIFQNFNDRDFFKSFLNIKDRCFFLPGTGVTKKKEQSIKKNKILHVILPARVLYDKGIIDFINVSQIVAKKVSKVSFDIVGRLDNSNPMKISRQKLSLLLQNKKKIRWLGFKKNTNEIFKNSYLTCFPSYHEGCPRALIESISYGKPVVCYDIPGNRNVVKNNFNGFKVKLHDYHKMANKVIEILLNDKLYKIMSKNCFKLSNNFSHVIINSKFKKIINKITYDKR